MKELPDTASVGIVADNDLDPILDEEIPQSLIIGGASRLVRGGEDQQIHPVGRVVVFLKGDEAAVMPPLDQSLPQLGSYPLQSPHDKVEGPPGDKSNVHYSVSDAIIRSAR